jgi:hypothetical protein
MWAWLVYDVGFSTQHQRRRKRRRRRRGEREEEKEERELWCRNKGNQEKGHL